MNDLFEQVTHSAIEPALDLLPARMDTPAARVMLLAIGMQESRLVHRRQIKGPARGLWQFEKGGGVKGVLTHSASAPHANMICAVRGVEPTQESVYRALEHDDILAAAFARLLMWTDTKPLPTEKNDAWDFYAYRTWRPGKPHRQTWDDFYEAAEAFVGGA